MKYLLFLSLQGLSLVSFAMKENECPQSFYAQVNNIYTQEEAMIAKRSDILSLKSISSNICYYQGEHDVLKARIQGSLEKGAKNPAQLVVYFTGNLSVDYVAYIEVLEKDAQGNLNFSGSAEIYKIGEFCSYGNCIPKHSPTGAAFFGFGYALTPNYN